MVDINLYLDDLNRTLWETMSRKFNINVTYGWENCYSCKHDGDNITIFVLKGQKPDSASFAHELLHLYLPSKDIRIGARIKAVFSGIPALYSIFDNRLYEHISNCLEHVKMFPVFLRMGYPKESFLQDYGDSKITFQQASEIRLFYRSLFSKKYKSQYVNSFIGLFFSAKADVNVKNNYDGQLNILKKTDRNLFSVLDSFWNEWLEYDVERHRDVWENDYGDLVLRFEENMIQWCSDKSIV